MTVIFPAATYNPKRPGTDIVLYRLHDHGNVQWWLSPTGDRARFMPTASVLTERP